MQLRDYLTAIGEGYDPAAGFDVPEQELLRRAAVHLDGSGPVDFKIKASGGQNPLGTTTTPWVGYFDPDETIKPQEGLYLVWILAADRSFWTLSVNMGTEGRANALKASSAKVPGEGPRETRLLEQLAIEAGTIRAELPASIRAGWTDSIDLKNSGTRQRRYEAATIIGKTYSVDAMPPADELRAELMAGCAALQEAVQIKRRLAVTAPGTISTASAGLPKRDSREYEFAPGTDVPTTQTGSGKPITRTPRHEGGLRRYGEWLIAQGFKPATNVHPRDFVVPGNPEWIGEYKVVYGTDEARATREALAQLKEYRHFLYGKASTAPLLAVFSQKITERRVRWLNAEGVAVVWAEGKAWVGCPLATAAGLAL